MFPSPLLWPDPHQWRVDLGPWPHNFPAPLPLHNQRLTGHLTEAALHDLAPLLPPPLGPALAEALCAHGQSDPVPALMGVVNVTPDSFSDGGQWFDTGRAVAHGLALVEAGADWLDVGGESTRPGAEAVPLEEELRRVTPVIEALARQARVPIAVDTSKGPVMAAALAAGASMINDVTALRGDPEAAAWLARERCPILLMHMQGEPRTMQQAPHYDHPTAEVYAFLAARMAWCAERGIDRKRLWVDPGIGFGKSTAHNLTLLRELRALRGLGAPVVLGVSRKRLIGELTGVAAPAQRDPGSHVLAAWGVLQGTALLRVHDVAGARQAVRLAQALK